MGSINIITTILNMRAPGMTLMKMPLFCWTWLITAYLLIAVMPVLAGAITMMLTDRHFGTTFFNAAGGGDPVMYQHIFWFFGHPEVYIMILPAFGIVCEIIPTFSRKPLFGYARWSTRPRRSRSCRSSCGRTTCSPPACRSPGQLFFMYATMLIAVPTGVKVFNWVATMWSGSMTFETPMLFAIGFIFVFTMGGFSGIVLAIAPVDIQLHDTYYVVAHFHYVMVAGALFALFAGIYYWMPKWTGHMYDEKLGKWHFWLTLIVFNVTFFPKHFLGLAGMPRRYRRLRAAVRRLQRRVHRRVRLRLLAADVLLVVVKCVRAAQGRRPAVGGRGTWSGRAAPGAVPHLRNPAGRSSEHRLEPGEPRSATTRTEFRRAASRPRRRPRTFALR